MLYWGVEDGNNLFAIRNCSFKFDIQKTARLMVAIVGKSL